MLPTNCYQSHRFLIQIFDNTPRSNPPSRSFHFWEKLHCGETIHAASCYGFLPITLDHGKMTHMFSTKSDQYLQFWKKKLFPDSGIPLSPRGLVTKTREVHKKLATTISLLLLVSAIMIPKSINPRKPRGLKLRSLQPQVFSNSHRMSQTNFSSLHVYYQIYLHVLIKFTFFPSSNLNSQLFFPRTFWRKQLFGSTPTRLSPLPWVISSLSDRSSISHGCINAS